MLAKLALRNVKRQVGNYLIYFITVSLTVALMFAVNSTIYSPQLLDFSENIREMKSALITLTVFVALIVAFVLGYATSFMLKLRKREFGMYLTLGMTRRNILSIFVLETLLIGLAALAAGIVLGLFIYQGLMMVLVHLMEIPFEFAAYSVKGLLLTVVLVAAVFLLSSVTSAMYLKKVSIFQLLHGDKIVDKKVKHPFLWFLVTLLSLAVVVGSCLLFSQALEDSVTGRNAAIGSLFGSLVALAVSLVTFHIGLARSIVNLLLKNRVFRSRGTNTFTLRQLSGKLGANSIMAGVLAFLIAFAIIGANVSFVQKVSEDASLNRRFPFDVSAILDTDRQPPIGLDEAERVIYKYNKISSKITYDLYTTGDNYIYGFTPWSGDGYDGLEDTYIKESDVNRLLTALGMEPIALNGGYAILSYTPQVMHCDFSNATLELNGKTYACTGKYDEIPMFSYVYCVAVVPDEAVENMSVQSRCAAYDLVNDRYDARALRAELSYTYTSGSGYSYSRTDYDLREYGRLEMNSTTAMLIISILYIAVVFVFMAMAILALKTLSSMAEDRQRYGILFRLGTGRREQSRTLFRQTFSFFLLPFALPLLLSIPAGMICTQIMQLSGLSTQAGQVALNTYLIAAVMTAIYLLYFTATYLIAKRSIVQTSI